MNSNMLAPILFSIFLLGGGESIVGISLDPTRTGDNGMKVVKVAKGSPADKCGIKEEDVIVELGGKRVGDSKSFLSALELTMPGNETTVKYRRGEEVIEGKIVPDKRLPAENVLPDRAAIQKAHERMKAMLAAMGADERVKYESLFRRLSEQTVRVVADDRSTGGTGVIVEDGKYVVTAGHVVKGQHDVNIYTSDGSLYAAVVVKEIAPRPVSTAFDFALIKLENPRGDKLNSATLGSTKEMTKGAKVILMGYPSTYGLTETGKILWGQYGGALDPIPRFGTKMDFISATQMEVGGCEAWHGDSGAPIFDIEGNVIGIACARKTVGGYISSIEAVKEELAKYLKEEKAK